MTTEERSIYLRIALAFQGISVHEKMSYRIARTLEYIEKDKGKFSIDDAVNLDFELAKREKELEVKNANV